MAVKKKNVVVALVKIKTTFNNTFVTVTDIKGDVIARASAGMCGYKNARKGLPYAAELAAKKAMAMAVEHGVKTASVQTWGPGSCREAAGRFIGEFVNVTSIQDMTRLPHNGCRPRKRRRQ